MIYLNITDLFLSYPERVSIPKMRFRVSLKQFSHS